MHTQARKAEIGVGLISVGIVFILFPIVNFFNVPLDLGEASISILFGVICIITGAWDIWFQISYSGDNTCISRWQKEIQDDEVFLGYYTQETFNALEVEEKRMGVHGNKKGKYPVFVKIPQEIKGGIENTNA